LAACGVGEALSMPVAKALGGPFKPLIHRVQCHLLQALLRAWTVSRTKAGFMFGESNAPWGGQGLFSR
jgi:hypothetical protein